MLNKIKINVSIIGSGFSSLSSACYLAKAGFEVNVYEKNEQLGGRARTLSQDGFTFDMGPSWYWMPDVFERFFSDFGKKVSDYYELKRLSPSYRVFFNDNSYLEIADNLEDIYQVFEEEEQGSATQLKEFLKKAQFNYEVAIKDLVYKPGVSSLELINLKTVGNLNQFVSNISKDIRKRFKSQKLIKILEFPVLFLGAKPQDTPSFYNFMNYADFELGTWYPMGGMVEIVEGMVNLAKEYGVKFRTNSNVEQITTEGKNATGLKVNGQNIASDIVLTGADYHHSETLLKDEKLVGYSQEYWEKKTFAPSSLIFYVGFNKKLINISHHMLFFDQDFELHAQEIYDNPKWPKAPLFYASFTSVTDSSVAPEGKEAGFFLIPIAPDLEDTPELRGKYFKMILERLEKFTHQSLEKDIILKESFCVKDFKNDYNSYKGNAYGMANTLTQTAFLRPKIQSKKVNNLFFTGQLTVPGPGVPPALISGKLASELIIDKFIKSKKI